MELRCIRGGPTFLSLIPRFRWIAVRLAMKPVISIIAPPQIVVVLVRHYFFFSNIHRCHDVEFPIPILVMLVNGEHRIGIYACEFTLHLYLYIYHSKKEPNIHSFIHSYTATKILEGEELFINYGPNFFPTPPNAKEKEEEPKSASSPSIHFVEDTSDSGSSYFEDSDVD